MCKLIREPKTVKSTLPKLSQTAKPSELLCFSCEHYHRLNVARLLCIDVPILRCSRGLRE